MCLKHLIEEVFKVCHVDEGSHHELTKTLARVRQNFWQDQMKKAVYYYMQACLSCQQKKKNKFPPIGQLQPIALQTPGEL